MISQLWKTCPHSILENIHSIILMKFPHKCFLTKEAKIHEWFFSVFVRIAATHDIRNEDSKWTFLFQREQIWEERKLVEKELQYEMCTSKLVTELFWIIQTCPLLCTYEKFRKSKFYGSKDSEMGLFKKFSPEK